MDAWRIGGRTSEETNVATKEGMPERVGAVIGGAAVVSLFLWFAWAFSAALR
jgi:hypothetical protein